MAGQSTLDFLGKANFRRSAAAATAQILEEADEAEAEMLSEIQRAQQSDDGRAIPRCNAALIRRTENIAYAMEMAAQGFTQDEAGASQDAEERHRQRLRKESEAEQFRMERQGHRRPAWEVGLKESALPPEKKKKLPSFLKVRASGAPGETVDPEAGKSAEGNADCNEKSSSAAATSLEAGAGSASAGATGLGLGGYDSDGDSSSDGG
eukprot:TRINITY_DN29036_c0_g1_i1.p1 TRINITY_DN29036_c0_g1~~TRINITY_DN29036_c0_g1_i1.p1  ORF type:complete len:208 (+),score=50.59 TRINITY_DN29036_c0_g1_i1:53-676(+)